MLLVKYVCSRRYLVDSPKKASTVVGFNYKSMGSRVVGFARQLKRCTVSCGARLHGGSKLRFSG